MLLNCIELSLVGISVSALSAFWKCRHLLKDSPTDKKNQQCFQTCNCRHQFSIEELIFVTFYVGSILRWQFQLFANFWPAGLTESFYAFVFLCCIGLCFVVHCNGTYVFLFWFIFIAIVCVFVLHFIAMGCVLVKPLRSSRLCLAAASSCGSEHKWCALWTKLCFGSF